MEVTKLIKKPIGRSKIEFYVTVDGQTTSEAIDAALDTMVRTLRVHVPEGKDPEEVLRDQMDEQQFNMLLQNHVMGRISPFIINDEEDLNMAFEPQCSSDEMPQRDEDFTFTIHVLLKPKYTLSSFDPVEVTVNRYVAPEEAIDKKIEQIAEINTAYEKIEDNGEPVQKGQFMIINMHTVKGGTEVNGLCGDGRLLELSYGFMPKDFIDNIEGMRVGETKTFNFEGPREGTMDEDNTEIYTTSVTITELRRRVVPEISDAWIEENMPDAVNLEGLRNTIREELSQNLQQQTDQELGQLVDYELSLRFEGKIADEIYETAAASIYQNFQANLRQQGKTMEEFMQENSLDQQQMNLQIMMQARNVIRQGLSLDKLFEEKFDGLDDEDIEEAYHAFAPGQEEEAKQQFAESGRMYAVIEVARRLKAHKWLLETAKINYQDVEAPIPDDMPMAGLF